MCHEISPPQSCLDECDTHPLRTVVMVWQQTELVSLVLRRAQVDKGNCLYDETGVNGRERIEILFCYVISRIRRGTHVPEEG